VLELHVKEMTVVLVTHHREAALEEVVVALAL